LCGGSNSTAHSAIRTGTPPDGVKFICKLNSKPYRSTVTWCVVLLSLVIHRIFLPCLRSGTSQQRLVQRPVLAPSGRRLCARSGHDVRSEH
jgi:hypothetical protein